MSKPFLISHLENNDYPWDEVAKLPCAPSARATSPTTWPLAHTQGPSLVSTTRQRSVPNVDRKKQSTTGWKDTPMAMVELEATCRNHKDRIDTIRVDAGCPGTSM